MTPLVQDEIASSSAFDEWAHVYDSQPNPLLSLEEKTLGPLLPNRADNIIDIGCGTGRWLTRLERMAPTSLVGIDSSAGMLQRARRKVSAITELRMGEGSRLICANNSQDLLIASFFLSYTPDITAFARECLRVLRPGGTLFVSDMHPVTAERFHWKRSFHANGNHRSMDVNGASLSIITDTFQRIGFHLELLREPVFGSAEEDMFRAAGRGAGCDELAGVPAIYILKLRKIDHLHAFADIKATGALHLANARVALSADKWMSEEIVIQDGRVHFAPHAGASHSVALDLSGYSILPGLINAHDHLEFGLFPKLGRSDDCPPYENAAQWAREIQITHRDIIDLHRKIPLSTRLWWGALRNILCGVTTVCHHNPMYAEFEDREFPVHVVSRLGWAHSLTFGGDLEQRHLHTPDNAPFILHAAEGMDEQSRDEIFELDRRQLLDERTVLVHGVALTPAEINLINNRGAALISCPTSNLFLFQRAPSTESLKTVHRLALGSDSSITAGGDLLDEVHCMHGLLGLADTRVYELTTTGGADVLHLRRHEGKLVPGGTADLVGVRNCNATPASTLSSLTQACVELVIRNGRVQMASTDIYSQLPHEHRVGLECLTIAGHQRWVRAPLANLFGCAETVLGRGNLMLSGRPLAYAGSV